MKEEILKRLKSDMRFKKLTFNRFLKLEKENRVVDYNDFLEKASIILCKYIKRNKNNLNLSSFVNFFSKSSVLTNWILNEYNPGLNFYKKEDSQKFNTIGRVRFQRSWFNFFNKLQG